MLKRVSPICILILTLFYLQISAFSEIVKGPYLCDVTETSVVICWETDRPTKSAVEYADEARYLASGGRYDRRVENRDKVELHAVPLQGLKPSTLYHYRVISGDDPSEDNTFHTAVTWREPFTVIVYGDCRTDQNAHRSVVERIIEHKPDLVLNTGDMVSDGRVSSQWDTFFDVAGELMRNLPYYPVLGNHERNAQNYYDLFHLPKGGGWEEEQWYSFDYGNAHFICLDSNFRFSADQTMWLGKDLARAAPKSEWIFVLFHHPPFSSGRHGGAAETMTGWIDLFEKYEVDIIFSGHDHTYERSFHNGIWYIVTGGGGAPLYPVNFNPNPHQVYAESAYHFCKLKIEGTGIYFEMIRADGSVGDSMTLTSAPAT
ncbi:TPA: metallophosphoesterase family protein, partial [Candidatus Poribacteria bacterium]|nr:metallophosphoesterase family protein [Candidatus Poribacteria bacterium]